MVKKIKCVVIYLMILSMVFSAGCSRKKSGKKDGEIYLYYINKNQDKLIKTAYKVKSSEPEEAAQEVLNQMNKTSKKLNVITAKPQEVVINGIRYENRQLIIDFGSGYNDVSNIREMLLRSAVVLTVTQIDGIDKVMFTVSGKDLLKKNGEMVGTMNRESFVDNSGSNVSTYTKVDTTIYFADETGKRLKPYNYTGYCDQNTSAEKMILQKLVSGAVGEGYVRTLPDNVGIMSVVTKDNICYINFNDVFLQEMNNVSKEAEIYSIVNSLCELSYISRVSISVNGKTDVKFGENISLEKAFERNLDLIDK